LYYLGEITGDEDAKGKYRNSINSQAGRQMLLTIANGGTKFYNNEHDSYFNDLRANGISGSNGYPVSNGIRKIAIANGSLSGVRNVNPSEKFYEVAAFAKVRFLGIKVDNKPVFRINNWFMAEAYNTSILLENYKRDNDAIKWTLTNNLPFGSLDAVPGGSLNSAQDVRTKVRGALEDKNAFTFPLGTPLGVALLGVSAFSVWTGKNLKIDQRIPADANVSIAPQAFIPTHSALDTKGFSDWYQPIDKNLVCTGQTPFDSFYGESINMPHITFTDGMVKWLIEELKGTNPQPPSFPISPTANTGADRICYEGDTSTYTLDPCKVPGPATWSVAGGLGIVSQTAYSVTVVNGSPGTGSITATFKNGLTNTRTVALGTTAPSPYFPVLASNPCSFDPGRYAPCVVQDAPHDYGRLYSSLSLTAVGIGNTIDSDWEWESLSEGFKFTGSNVSSDGKKAIGKDFVYINFTSYVPDFIQFRCRVKNVCTWGEWKTFIFNFSDGRPLVTPPPPPPAKYFTFSPNPTAGDTITISLFDENIVPPNNSSITVSVWTTSGALVLPERNLGSTSGGTFYVGNLLNRTGYLLRIKVNNVTETHYLIKS
jgi:hypothetical protein